MSLETQISLMTVPQEFARLCNALLRAQHGDDFLPIDDDQPDAGNDGYLKSEKRMFAMHCFKRAQNQGLEQLIRRKMVGDLGKAIALKRAGEWDIRAWTFVSNYPVSQSVATKVIQTGAEADVQVSWTGPAELAALLRTHPSVQAGFPQLQVSEVSERLGEIQDEVVALARDLKPEPIDFSGVPRTPEQQAHLIATKPDCWEYLLFAGALLQGEEALEFDYLDHKLRITREREPLDFRTASEVMGSTLHHLTGALEPLNRAFGPDAQEHAFGLPGEPGDVKAIQHLARVVIDTYDVLLRAGERLRSIDPPKLLRHTQSLAIQMLDAPVAGIRDFVSRTVSEIERLPEHLAQGTPITVRLDLVLDVDEQVLKQYEAETDRVARKVRRRNWTGLDLERR